ncbi:hypothetical protein B9N43_01940 [Denitratisoma sp. DHT3]|uniref:hypothetical protein n=1 Tax=Denitratisoma sp. DHT3 TaxID=1981880 RepID=UPI0011989A24|nr:hypothetical protein [Denitratisoma sp. DHT3]QDX80124.1 hypothetical protein B9N43_01940 [Denitratisoma sp. DHT3]
MFFKRILGLLAAVGLSLGGALAAEHHHGHDHHAAAPARPTLKADGTKWTTDAPLRNGMEQIRTRMGAALADIHGGRLTAAQYRKLSGDVRGEVNTIIASCKLDPQADAQLHTVIGEMLAGAEKMTEKSKAGRQRGAVAVVKGLEDYAAYFEHPGWQPLTAESH